MNTLMVPGKCIVSCSKSNTSKNNQSTNEDVKYEKLANRPDTPSVPASASNDTAQPEFIPAYYDTETDTVYLSRFSNGTVAPVHVLDSMPRELLQQGDIDELSGKVVVGFVLNDRFYTRKQALEALNEHARKVALKSRS